MGTKKHKKQKTERFSENEESLPPEKPLKLVLNLKGSVGSSQDSQLDDAASPTSEENRRHKHKKKKKKKSSDKEKHKYSDEQESYKRKREEVEEESEEAEEYDTENIPVAGGEMSQLEDDNANDSEMQEVNMSPSRKLREPRTCTVRDSDGYVLRQMLNYLLKTLQNKDVNGFFAFPVTDTIAPGYSTIILHPMDFSTMATKVEASEYVNVMEFKKDFVLMCNNAMTYNHQDTIFYKEAKRLLAVGIRLLSKEKLLHLKKTHSYISSISLRELGFDETGQVIHIEPKVPAEQLAAQKEEEQIKSEKEEEIPDPARQEEIEAEKVLEQAQTAAEEAKNTLVARKPNTDLGFLRLNENGTTTMTILNPWNDGVVSSKQRVISLGDYMGKLKNGTGSLFKHKEDKRNRVDTETYLCYGPFSSHAPSYDSSFATCSKEESDLLLSTYGGEIGVQYAKSVQKFVENSGISAIEMVDKLLDTLTDGQHSKTIHLQEQQKRKEEEQHQKELQDEMITRAQQAADEAERDKVQINLNETAALISELSQTQKERLSRDLPAHISNIQPPCSKEADLANQVSNSLVQMARQVNPQHVVSTGALRDAMGITCNSVGKSRTLTASPSQSDNNRSENGGRVRAEEERGLKVNTVYSSGEESDGDDASDSEQDNANDDDKLNIRGEMDEDDDDDDEDDHSQESVDDSALTQESVDEASDMDCSNTGFSNA